MNNHVGIRVSYRDLSLIILQADDAVVAEHRDVLFKMMKDNYGRMMENRSLLIDVCPKITRNSFKKGVGMRIVRLLHRRELWRKLWIRWNAFAYPFYSTDSSIFYRF